MSLRGIVEERSGEQIGIVVAGGEEPIDDVERVAPIGDRHAVEEGCRIGGKNAVRQGRLLVRHARSKMRGELANPVHDP
jgi:hypothetical protein